MQNQENIQNINILPKKIVKFTMEKSRSVGENEILIERLSSALKISKILAEILVSRGYDTIDVAKSFLYPTLRNDLPDPNLLKNISETVDLIVESIRNDKYITIFSDFDVDGISSAAQLWIILKNAGAKLRYYVPNRMREGYGLSKDAIEKLHQEKTELLITLDCGITNIEEVRRAKELGLDVIIVDHHEVGSKLPSANCIINHMQKDCGFHGTKLCTAGIVWLLSIVLLKSLQTKLSINLTVSSKELLDLAAIGTICDMVPLRGVNRLIASKGIEAIRANPRIGIKAIQEIAQLPMGARFSCSSVAFGIGPRLNAAGRLEDASIGMSLLISDSSTTAKNLAEKINGINVKRRSLEDEVKTVCLELAKELEQALGKSPSAYTLFSDNFHVGVIGIAAQRMVESLSRPVAVLGKADNSENEGVVKGSVRSINGFHISQTLNQLTHLLLSHGGHKEAGGFSILEKNISQFTLEFNDLAEKFFLDNPLSSEIRFDQIISFKDININLVKEIELLAPFGTGNPSPVFLTKAVEITNFHQIGTNHVKLELKQDSTVRNAIAWRMIGNPIIERNKRIDLIYSLELNTYKGISSVQLIIRELLQSN